DTAPPARQWYRAICRRLFRQGILLQKWRRKLRTIQRLRGSLHSKTRQLTSQFSRETSMGSAGVPTRNEREARKHNLVNSSSSRRVTYGGRGRARSRLFSQRRDGCRIGFA